jgi:carboxyl-terminal processing protease
MRKLRNALFMIIPVALLSYGFYLKNTEEGEEMLMQVILENLANHHFSPVAVNDDLSENAFKNYLDAVDGNKRFYLQEDIDRLSAFKKDIDDESMQGRFDLFDLSMEILDKRIVEREAAYKEILSKPFTFSSDETVNLSDDLPFAKTEKELNERWRTYLKYNVMTRLSAKIDVQEAAASKSDTVFRMTPMDSLEIFAREDILKNHDEWFARMKRVSRKERLSAYVNSITRIFDPHTNYFPPEDKENFDIRMSGRLEGIGAQLQEKDGYIKVVNIIPGSPSALQGDLAADDLILKVGQGKEEPVNIVNAKINDAVQLIRGKKGTEVRLTVQKPDGVIKVIPIVRDVVLLEETYAKSLLLNDQDEKKVGYLYLPSFYTDFTGNKGRTSWKDVSDELTKLQNDGAEALIFDLRSNGGGSLNDVVQMAGLFIKDGPIVQVKANQRDPEVLRDNDSRVQWDKPVVVLVNEFSASASEILAAALQDYKRAVIIGSHTTHGKGTVQRFIPLNQTLRNRNAPDLGALKLTTQKFYRINGGATQLKGVTPDIIMPDNYSYIETGEQEQEYAMAWDQIEEVKYEVSDKWLKRLDLIKRNSQNRINKEPIFNSIDENAKRWKSERDKDVFTLNLEQHRKEEKERHDYSQKYDSLFVAYDQMKFNLLSADRPEIIADTGKLKRSQDWQKRLGKDPYLLEALQVSEDLIKHTK